MTGDALPPRGVPLGHALPWMALILLAGALVALFLILGPFRAVSEELRASGTVEADEVLIGSEVLARIVDRVPEGAQVQSGDVLVRLDDSLVQLQLRQALDNPAQTQLLEWQARQHQLQSPISGTVSRASSQVGEVASPGQTLLAVTDLTRLKLTIFVLQRDLDHVHVGQRVAISADPFDGRTFSGVVTAINQRAEFTPRNVQTQRDRLNLVFGVQVRVDNPDLALKPGMPVDATFASR